MSISLRIHVVLLVLIVMNFATYAFAQFREQEDSIGVQLGETVVQRWIAGCEFTAGQKGSRHIVVTAPIPANWPEQRVRVISEDTSSGTRLTYRNLPPGVRQMVAVNDHVSAGRTFRALVTFEVARAEQIPPEDTSIFVLATSRTMPTQARVFLRHSKFMESNNSRMRTIFNEATSEPESDWEKILAVYDYVRDNVEYKDEDDVKGAVDTLQDGSGDCKAMTGLFVAICRAGSVPARTVWVDGHCYPEFLLLDDEGEPHWFPCQIAGTYAFGGMPDLRIILSKGDLFRTPEKPDKLQRFVGDYLSTLLSRTSSAPVPGSIDFRHDRLTD